jgi:predicted ATP-grasp superfamily ATP-dependent carboligase
VDGGSGALNTTVYEPEITENTMKIMKALNWHGVGMAEFKRDSNGEAKLIEINPKFWGTSECAISAGMNFPYMLYKIAMDGDVKANFSYLYPKSFGWLFPMGIKSIFETNEPLAYMKKYLQLLALKNSTDIRLLEDPRPFPVQLYQTILSLADTMYTKIKNKKK